MPSADSRCVNPTYDFLPQALGASLDGRSLRRRGSATAPAPKRLSPVSVAEGDWASVDTEQA